MFLEQFVVEEFSFLVAGGVHCPLVTGLVSTQIGAEIPTRAEQ